MTRFLTPPDTRQTVSVSYELRSRRSDPAVCCLWKIAAERCYKLTLPNRPQMATVTPSNARTPRSCWILAAVTLLLSLSVTTWAERLPMRLYTTEDGLWSSFINHIMLDSRGFLWFCTRDGLSRFDGYRFINYRIAGGPVSQNFTYLFESRGGVFWISVGDKELYRYEPGSATSSAEPSRADSPNGDGRVLLQARLVSSSPPSAMFQDHKGALWAAAARGLFLVEEKPEGVSFHEIDLHVPQDREPFLVRNFAEGDDASLWVGTNHGLLRRLPDGRVVQYHLSRSPSSLDVRGLVADKSGNIWASYPGGVYVLRPEPISALTGTRALSSITLPVRRQNLESPLPRNPGEAVELTSLEALGGLGESQVIDIFQKSNGQIWLVAKNRLVLFDGRHFYWFEDTRGAVRGVVEDADGDLWLTTTRAGVVRFSVRGLTSYDVADGLANLDIASIHEDSSGRLQVVSAGWMINELEGRKFRSVHANIPDVGVIWTSPLGFVDHTGQWWFLTRSGLYRFAHVHQIEDLARATPRVYTNLDGLPGQWLYCIFEDSRGDLWISTRDYESGASGLVRWERRSETFHRLTEADGLPPGKAAGSFAEDRAGNLWFGFYEGGLARYAAGRFTIFTPADGLPDGFITALHLDHLGRLWLTTTSGGLARIDDPTSQQTIFVCYTTQQGLSSNNVRTMTEDLAGNIYVGTVRGVDRLTPETNKFKHYGLIDGLAGDFVTTAYCDHKGAIWFGTFNGLSRLDPHPDPVLAAPPIRIEGLRIAGVKQPISEFGANSLSGLELSAAQNNLQIDFSSLSIARASLLRYQYQLHGVDHDWSAPTDQRTVHYANLAPGTYRFLVRAVDPGGLSSTQPASLDFRILPPFWKRWWFLALVAIALAFAGTLLYRYRVAHLLELERVRTHIATDLHDDIGSSLSQIAVLSEVVRRQVEGTEAVAQPLSTIASTSRELVDSMSDIVWAINPNRDNLSDLAHRMRRFASDLFTANDIEFRFDSSEAEQAMRLDAEVRRQVFLIFKESAHNIVRHSGCSSVEVGLRVENHTISLTLKDDGKGFDIEQASEGHGLMSMNRRAKSLGADLEISSQAGIGTVVALKVPLA